MFFFKEGMSTRATVRVSPLLNAFHFLK